MQMVDKPISLSFAFRPRSNIVTDRSAAQSGATLLHMHSRYLPNSNSFIYGASHREAVSTFFKVFARTRPRVDQNPRPTIPNSKRILYHCPLHFRVIYIYSINLFNTKYLITIHRHTTEIIIRIFLLKNLINHFVLVY